MGGYLLTGQLDGDGVTFFFFLMSYLVQSAVKSKSSGLQAHPNLLSHCLAKL